VDTRRYAVGLTAVALSVAGGLSALFLAFGRFDGGIWKLLTTAVLVGVFSLLAYPGARLLDQGRSSILAWSAVLLAGAGLLWSFRIVWSEQTDADGSWRLLVTLAACATAVTQVCITTARRHETDSALVERLYAGSNLLAYSLAGLLTLACWDALGTGWFFWRSLALLAAIDLVCVGLQPLLRVGVPVP
jgi:hypothetical protein